MLIQMGAVDLRDNIREITNFSHKKRYSHLTVSGFCFEWLSLFARKNTTTMQIFGLLTESGARCNPALILWGDN